MSALSAARHWLYQLAVSESAIVRGLNGGDTVLVGLSGGADSLALTWAGIHLGLNVHAVVIDHQLQAGSAQVAQRAAEQARQLGATAEVIPIQVDGSDEATARHARYAALGKAADGRGVLVAHTSSDEAEGFLLNLSRGSGTDSLAGMRPFSRRHPVAAAGAAWIGRPLLACSRADTESACREAGLEFWSDPHNHSPAFLRSRVRHDLLPAMQRTLGPHIGSNLARSARLLRDDADALDSIARQVMGGVEVASDKRPGERPGLRLGNTGRTVAPDRVLREKLSARADETRTQCGGVLGTRTQDSALDCVALNSQPAAIRRRIYRLWLEDVAGPLTGAHIDTIDRLVTHWRGQGPVAVPWPRDSHTMNEYQRATHRLVVRRVDAQLHRDVSPR